VSWIDPPGYAQILGFEPDHLIGSDAPELKGIDHTCACLFYQILVISKKIVFAYC
jgi:hypothetical protein